VSTAVLTRQSSWHQELAAAASTVVMMRRMTMIRIWIIAVEAVEHVWDQLGNWGSFGN